MKVTIVYLLSNYDGIFSVEKSEDFIGVCMIDLKNGSILIGHEIKLNKDFTFEKFKESKLYNGQEGIRIIDLKEIQIIDGKKYSVSLLFKEGIMYMVSMINCDCDISMEQEMQRKEVHDKILENMGIQSGNVYSWGKIVSQYDSKSNISSINIYYS